jgi:predicted permease
MSIDLHVTCRSLVKSPAFSITAVLALALGIGVNTAIFSIVNEVLLNPAGVRDPGRIVAIRARYDKVALKSIPVSVPDFADVQTSTRLFEAAALSTTGNYNNTGSGVAEWVRGASVSLDWFKVFGAKPQLGRVFQAEEDRPNANRVAVLSFAAWKRLYGQEPGILGRTLELNQTPYRIIGVMGPEFRWPATADLWIPLGLAASAYDAGNRFNENYDSYARLKTGVGLAEASGWLKLLNDRVKNDGSKSGKFATDAEWGTFLVPFTDYIAGDTKRPMLVLLIAVGFVLLIACSNIAGLMLARASGRARELALRTALGATRWNLAGQALTESLVLSCAGALLGLVFGYAGIRALLLLVPENAAVALDVRMDSTVLIFTSLVAIASGILFGIAPAWQVSQVATFTTLKEGGRSGTAGLNRQRLRSGLVVGEVALALVLLVGAGLFLRSLAYLQEVNPGFEPTGVITGAVTLPANQYKDAARCAAFYGAVLDRLSSQPGVTSAAAGVQVPFNGQDGSSSFEIEGRPSHPGDPGPHGDFDVASAGYFATLKIPLESGRAFSSEDQSKTAPVAVIDENLARQYWPNENPIGKHIRFGAPDPWRTIVGVAAHTKHSNLAGDFAKGKFYFALPQVQFPLQAATLMVRTETDPSHMVTPLREAVRAVDPSLAVSQIRTMTDMISQSLESRRFVVTLLGVFAILALLLAVIGLYGVISYSVTQRTPELGIRMALGAQRSEVLALVVGHGMKLAAIGAAIGLAASVALGRLLSNQLFRVSSFDPITFALTAVVLIGAALLACYIPARRATRVDPMNALRYE